jgi:4-amino-4-deoxy-L-arabinose transferase-like glycosyltransferase
MRMIRLPSPKRQRGNLAEWRLSSSLTLRACHSLIYLPSLTLRACHSLIYLPSLTLRAYHSLIYLPSLTLRARLRSAGPVFVLLVLCWLLFFHNLAERDLWSSHESRAAQDAQSILDEDCWGLPHLFDGRAELQKPPFYYWLVAAIAWLRGGRVDAWCVRLPAALSATGCVFGLFLLCWKRGRQKLGLIAAIILATSLHFTWLARSGRIDMPLTLTVGLAVWGFSEAVRGVADHARDLPHSQWQPPPWGLAPLLVAYLAIALGTLLKGPIAAVLPLAVAGLLSCLCGSWPVPWRTGTGWSPARRLGLWWGLPLAGVLTVPWFLWANVRTDGAFFRVFFLHHNLDRLLGTSSLLKGHPWWFYGPRVVVDFLPWTPVLILGLWSCCRERRWRVDEASRLGLAWFTAVILVLSCSAFKRADYLLPAYPGAALFMGTTLERWLNRARRPARLIAALAGLVIACGAGWLSYIDWHIARGEEGRDSRPLASQIRQLAPTPTPVLFFRTESHALAFHVGRPVELSVEWKDLDAWVRRPDTSYVVMPARCQAENPGWFPFDRLEEVARFANVAGPRSDRPLVLWRKRPER